MLKCISNWAYDAQMPLEEVFKSARNHGFDGVELCIDSGGLTLASSQDDCARIVELAGKSGIKLSSVASGGGWSSPISAPDPATRRRGIDEVASMLQVTSWLNLDTALLVPGGVAASFIPGFQGAPYDVAWENASNGINELKAVAERTGVNIGVENVWNMFLLSPLEMREFVDSFASDRVGVYFDTGNVILYGYAEQWIDILGSRIKRVHFKDFKRSVGTLDGFCDLLEGDVDYPAVMKSLRNSGYDGPVTAEFFGCSDEQLAGISKAMDKILTM